MCVLAFLCMHCEQPMNTFSTMQKLRPLRYEILIYFPVEDSQGNFTVLPLEKVFPACLLFNMTLATTAGTVTFLQNGTSLPHFQRLVVCGRLPQHPHPCF